jgi:hypothetical protein
MECGGKPGSPARQPRWGGRSATLLWIKERNHEQDNETGEQKRRRR